MIDSKLLPKVSINIPVYNNLPIIRRCLDSIFFQDYPKEKIEVLYEDGGSTDGSRELAKEYNVKFIDNVKRDPVSGRMLGLKHATGTIHFYLDADMALPTKDWISKMVLPLVEHPELAGSFTLPIPHKDDPPLNRYFCYNELQLDPLLRFFSPKIKTTIIEDAGYYKVCDFSKNRVPFVGVILIRMELIKKLFANKRDDWMWSDVDFPIWLAKNGYTKFAFLPDMGFYHTSYTSIKKLLSKNRRNIYWSFLPSLGKDRDAIYIDINSKKDLLKLLVWIIYANSIIPGFIKGLIDSFKKNDFACLYEPIVALVSTDHLIYLFLSHPEGRKLISKALRF